MAASRLPIKKSHFLRKLHKRQLKHIEWQRKGLQQPFDELEKQEGTDPLDASDKALVKVGGAVSVKIKDNLQR